MKSRAVVLSLVLLAITATSTRGHGFRQFSGFGYRHFGKFSSSHFGKFGHARFGHFGRGAYFKDGFGFGYFGLGRGAAVQDLFEDCFTDLMTEYDEAQNSIDDFFNSDEYNGFLAEAEELRDDHGRFLDRKQNRANRFDEHVTRIDERLMDLQEDRPESPKVDRLTRKLERAQDIQMELNDELTTISAFQQTLLDYLTDIQNMGSGTEMEAQPLSGAAAALSATFTSLPGMEFADVEPATGIVHLPSGSALNTISVPEPSTAWLLWVGCGLLMRRRR